MFGAFVVQFWAAHDKCFPSCRGRGNCLAYDLWMDDMITTMLEKMGKEMGR